MILVAASLQRLNNTEQVVIALSLTAELQAKMLQLPLLEYKVTRPSIYAGFTSPETRTHYQLALKTEFDCHIAYMK